MKSDIRDLWAASLMDGSYKQGRYQLRDLDDRFDPCGVLCDLAVLAGVIDQPKKYDHREGGLFFGYQYGDVNGQGATLPPKKVLEWADLPAYRAHRVSLMGDKGMKFPELAEWIKENL